MLDLQKFALWLMVKFPVAEEVRENISKKIDECIINQDVNAFFQQVLKETAQLFPIKDIEQRREFEKKLFAKYSKPDDLSENLFEKIEDISEEKVSAILVFIFENIERTKDQEGKTLLHYATCAQCFEIIDIILQQNKLPRGKRLQDAQGNTPLHYAVELLNTANARKIIEIFVKNENKLKQLERSNKNGYTPIQLIIENDDLEFYKLVESSLALKGLTYYVVMEGARKILEYLIKNKKQNWQERGPKKNTILHAAVLSASAEIFILVDRQTESKFITTTNVKQLPPLDLLTKRNFPSRNGKRDELWKIVGYLSEKNIKIPAKVIALVAESNSDIIFDYPALVRLRTIKKAQLKWGKIALGIMLLFAGFGVLSMILLPNIFGNTVYIFGPLAVVFGILMGTTSLSTFWRPSFNPLLLAEFFLRSTQLLSQSTVSYSFNNKDTRTIDLLIENPQEKNPAIELKEETLFKNSYANMTLEMSEEGKNKSVASEIQKNSKVKLDEEKDSIDIERLNLIESLNAAVVSDSSSGGADDYTFDSESDSSDTSFTFDDDQMSDENEFSR